MTRLAAFASPEPRHPFTSVKALFFCAALLAASTCYAPAHATETSRPAAANSCATFGDAFDDGTDIHAMDAYRSAVGQLVQNDDFQQLECIANTLRTKKMRFAGGRLAVARLL
jgi:hypothetical protein